MDDRAGTFASFNSLFREDAERAGQHIATLRCRESILISTPRHKLTTSNPSLYHQIHPCFSVKAFQIQRDRLPPTISEPIEQPVKDSRINTPRRSKVKIAIRHRESRRTIIAEERERRPVCPNGVKFRQGSRDVLKLGLPCIAQPGVVDGAQNDVLLRWADIERCRERWV